MKSSLLGSISLSFFPIVAKFAQEQHTETDIIYIDGLNLTVRGKYHNENNYHRLPSSYKNEVRPKIWSLSNHSSGIYIHFWTDSPEIRVKWKLSNFSSSPNMTDIAKSGLDLYCRVDDRWQYVNSGIPHKKDNESVLITNMNPFNKEFILNLPLYNKVEKIGIGILKEYNISPADSKQITGNKIVYYGTSITQGASASRPGMAYPAIISRNLGIESINFGFSGNGRFEKSIANILCDINLQLLVLDCTPNSSPEIIKDNTILFIQKFRKCHSKIPILLVESIIREYSYFKITDPTLFGSQNYLKSQNNALKEVYKNAQKLKIENIFYLDSCNLIGSDHEATVDGTHLSDLGMMRIAAIIENEIIKILNLKRIIKSKIKTE